MLDTLRHDLRQAARAAAGRRGHSALVVLSFALAIGANALLYSVVDATILRPLPFPALDRLVGVGAAYPTLDQPLEFFEALSGPEYLDIRDGSRAFSAVAGFDLGNEHVLAGDTPERVFTAYFWDDPLPVLGVQAAAGRSFTAAEIAASAKLAIISDAFWRARFGGLPAALGSVLRISGQPYTIVGVMQPHARLYDTELWLPMAEPAARTARNRRQFNVIARVRPDVALAEVQAELAVVAAAVEAAHRGAHPEYRGWRLEARPWTRVDGWPFARTTLIAFAVVGLLLLLVCANLTNLTMARLGARRREMGIRVALGSGRRRLVRQLLAESLLLAAVGGAAGLALALGGIRTLPGLLPPSIVPPDALYRLDWRLIAFTTCVSAVSGVLVSLAPALQASRADIRQVLVAESGTIAGGGRGRLRAGLVAAQIAVAVLVVAAAALLAVAIGRILRVDPGFPARGLVAMRLTLPPQRYDGAARTRFFEELLEQVRGLDAVMHATVALQFPPAVFSTSQFEIEGVTPAGGALPSAFHTIAGSGYLETLSVPIRQGRWLDDRATPSGPAEVVVNEAAARRFFAPDGALGRRIRIAGPASDGRPAEVVGVIADVRNRGLAADPQPELFTSLRQAPERRRSQLYLLLRTARPGTSVVADVRQLVRRLDPEQPVYGVSTVERTFAAGLGARRTAVTLLAWSAALATILAALGIYGVLSQSVVERTPEIGVRMALGATRGTVARLVIRQALAPVGIGIAAGCLLVFLLGRGLAAWLYGVQPEAGVLAAVVGGIIPIAVLAALVPAIRASRVEPVEALRS